GVGSRIASWLIQSDASRHYRLGHPAATCRAGAAGQAAARSKEINMSGTARCDPLRFTPCKFHHAGDVARDPRSAPSSNRRRLDEATPTRQTIPTPGATGIPVPAISAMVGIARRVWSSAWTLL